MKKVMKYKELFEGKMFLNDVEFNNIDDRYEEIFNLIEYNTEKIIDMEYYIEFGFKHVLEFCLDTEIIPNKKIMEKMVEKIKDFASEYFLYTDKDNINEEDELSFIVNDFIEELETMQPKEYKKYLIKKDLDKFNI